jgi:hypothetical protein
MCETCEPGAPDEVMDAAFRAWREFRKAKHDWRLFDACDWCIKMAAIRWDSYREARLCAAGAEWSRQVAPCSEARVSEPFLPGGHRRDK